MNKPNKSLVAARKTGLVHATATLKHEEVVRGWNKCLDDYLLAQQEKVAGSQILKSYRLGLRGIRIGQEAHFETAR